MFNCFKFKKIPQRELITNEYPVVCYIVTSYDAEYNNTIWRVGFESEKDAQQYCIDNQGGRYVYSYYTGIFQPPSYDNGSNANYPHYVYPIMSKRTTDTTYLPNPPYVFAIASDAETFEHEHTNPSIYTGYSCVTWVPANSYKYELHGYTGHRFFNKPIERALSPVVEPKKVVYP